MADLAITVIIPTHNRAHLIHRALHSALRQLRTDDEVIVIDDGSTDNTQEVLQTYADKVRIFRIENRGAGAARNFGISQATKPLIAFLDSDDEWMDNKIAIQRPFMSRREDVLFCFSDFAVTFVDGQKQHNYLFQWHHDPRPWDEILGPGEYFSKIAPLPEGVNDFKFFVGDLYPAMIHASYVNTCTLVARREEAGDALHFAEDLPLYEDMECYARLARKGKAAYLDIETTWQHGHSGPRLTDGDLLSRVRARIKILERIWGADQQFLSHNLSLYRSKLNEQRLLEISELISLGRTGEARDLLAGFDSHVPLPVRLLAALPGCVARRVLLARRRLRQAVSR